MPNKSNQTKNRLLGQSHGAATNRLRKMLLWRLVVETGQDICFQCGEQIDSVDDLSIEHKEPWQSADDPRAAFFDLENIAFSHLSCNIGAANQPKVYPNTQARDAAQWARYYGRHSDIVLRRKRERYHRNKKTGSSSAR